MQHSSTSIVAALSLAFGLLSVPAAQAAVITGSLGYTSLFGFSADHPNLTLATSLTLSPSVVAGTVTGTFADVGIAAGDAITLPANPLLVNSALAVPVEPIWSIAGFSLTLTSIEELPGNVPTSLALSGNGIITGPGWTTPTLGSWVATFNRAGSNFTFSSSSTAAVPEGGASLTLLGVSLLGLMAARQTFKKIKSA